MHICMYIYVYVYSYTYTHVQSVYWYLYVWFQGKPYEIGQPIDMLFPGEDLSSCIHEYKENELKSCMSLFGYL